jgi:exonuclease SbcC
MRPIVMDMHGFASFREQTRVDFTDADFFALVGPTGAGKSTVIDAMTFALYGSVPRWGRKGMVSLAMAPTVGRATVKLIFEVDRQRYVVARELRRMGSQVSQRAASLERIIDPDGLAEKDDKTAPMAKDLASVTDAVERLLGLSYEDFIQCVVLPQGQFADFLHAKPADRQEILLRLLGAEHYKQMMIQANQRASAAAQRAGTIGESLLTYADATEEAERRSRTQEAALAALADQVSEILPRIQESTTRLSAAQERLGQLTAENAALVALRVPDGIAVLDANLMASRADLARLADAEREAEGADSTAREWLAAGPQRAPLELARERRDELKRLRDEIPGLNVEAERLATQAEAAAGGVESASAAVEALRVRRDAAAQEAALANELVARLEREHAVLASVSVPDGVTALDSRWQAAADAVTETGRALAAAEQADTAARESRDAAVPEGSLTQVARDLSEFRELLVQLRAARDLAARASVAKTEAEAELARAIAGLAQQRESLEEAQRAHVIAGLRPHLVAGEACPLCEQTVATLPAALAAPELEDAVARQDVADRAVARARDAVTSTTAATERAGAELESNTKREARLRNSLASALNGPLTGAPLPAVRAVESTGNGLGAELLERATTEVAALMQTRARLEQVAAAAAKGVAAQRTRHGDAQAAARQAEADLVDARNALRAARDPLVDLGAPQVDATSLAAGWAALARWAVTQAGIRAADLETARAAARETAGRHSEAADQFDDKERGLARLRANASTAMEENQQARAKLDQITGRVAELGELLGAAPSDAQISEQLALLARLENAVVTAREALRTARAARGESQLTLTALEGAEGAARAGLSLARDSVVALGAPVLEGSGLLGAWTQLTSWAAGQAAARERLIGTASDEVSGAQASVKRLTGEVSAALAAAGIEVAPDVAGSATAATAVAAELERARAAVKRVVERRAEAADLRGKQQAAQEEQDVAGLLGDLLRANNFQRWLVNAAVDDLVAEASATLSALSAGQFDLFYDDGDFFVIDHADADARRSVRTLSGGETFQASLALALALSSQISALAAAGAARLDSIFLDEGFGTLDPETLDVVATTLETLAQGERMVGVVTHVSALAERVPVRFRVTRNALTSTISREGVGATVEEVTA